MRRSHFLTLLLMLTGILVVGQLYLTIPLIPGVADRFRVTPEAASLAGTFFGFAYAAGFLIFGPLSDRVGRRLVLLTGLAVLAVVTMMLGFVSSFPQFLAGRAFQGFVAASFPPVALSLMAEALPAQERPWGISLMSFAFLSSAPISQYVALSLTMPPDQIMLWIAPAYVLMVLALFLVLPPASPVRAASAVSKPNGLRHLALNPAIVSGWLAAMTVLFGFIAFQIGTTSLVQGDQVLAQQVRLAGLIPLGLSIIAAPISRRLTPRITARIGLALAATGLVAGMTVALILTAAALVSAGVALAVPGLIGMISGAAQDYNRGQALSFYTFFLFIGASLSAPVSTALMVYGPPAVFGLPAALLAGATLLLGVPRRRQPETLPSVQPATGD